MIKQSSSNRLNVQNFIDFAPANKALPYQELNNHALSKLCTISNEVNKSSHHWCPCIDSQCQDGDCSPSSAVTWRQQEFESGEDRSFLREPLECTPGHRWKPAERTAPALKPAASEKKKQILENSEQEEAFTDACKWSNQAVHMER